MFWALPTSLFRMPPKISTPPSTADASAEASKSDGGDTEEVEVIEPVLNPTAQALHDVHDLALPQGGADVPLADLPVDAQLKYLHSMQKSLCNIAIANDDWKSSASTAMLSNSMRALELARYNYKECVIITGPGLILKWASPDHQLHHVCQQISWKLGISVTKADLCSWHPLGTMDDDEDLSVQQAHERGLPPHSQSGRYLLKPLHRGNGTPYARLISDFGPHKAKQHRVKLYVSVGLCPQDKALGKVKLLHYFTLL